MFAGPIEIIRLIHLDSESGEIVVANKIDHETNEWLNFTVKATDSGIPSRFLVLLLLFFHLLIFRLFF